MTERRVSRIVFTCMVLGFVALIAAGAMAAYTVAQAQRHTRWVEHTYGVQTSISELRAVVEHVEAARRGYLLSGNRLRRTKFEEARKPIPGLVASIRNLTVDNPAQQANVARLAVLLRVHAARLDASTAIADVDLARAARQFESDGTLESLQAIRRMTNAMETEEQRLLDERVAAQRATVMALFQLLVVAGVVLAIVATFSIVVLRRYIQGMATARAAVEALNAELEDRVEERTTDLRRANEEIQRFAYIVSHDLRSPLVNVMGFTGELEAAARPLSELIDAAEREAPHIVTEDARLAAREDLPESIRFIRSSTQKMDRLINAILRLSREGKRVLAPEPVDIAQVADHAVQALRHRLDEIGAEITVERPMPEIVADRLAVEQMLSNLIENAVKYLDPARPGRITISAKPVRDRVAIAIADNGRGIDPRDHDRIFDLFRRSGQQDQPGEGIGLAHVRALAYRLGGLIDCRSALGQGATFTLTLPVQPPLPQGPTP